MASLSEKRVYRERRGGTVAYVASGDGLARVSVAGDRVGRFSLVRRETTTDVAGDAGRLLVATPSDVLVGGADGFAATGFGRSAAVGVEPKTLLTAGPDGRVAALEGDDWRSLGTVESPRRFDGRLLAAADGVYQIADGLVRLGLADVRDVAADSSLAATARGVHRYGDDGWTRVYDGESVTCVAAGDGHRHLVDDGELHEFAQGEWRACTLPVDEAVADVAYGELPYAVTDDGTFLVEATPERTPDNGTGWRHSALGLSGCASVAVA